VTRNSAQLRNSGAIKVKKEKESSFSEEKEAKRLYLLYPVLGSSAQRKSFTALGQSPGVGWRNWRSVGYQGLASCAVAQRQSAS
jgi:hypothetical protein